MKILKNLNAENSHVEAIRAKLFDVVQKPLFTNQEGFESPEVFATYKSTGGKPFGVLGKVFTATQPTVLFDNFVDCLISNTQADLKKVRYSEFKGGAKILFSAPIKTTSFTNLAGKEDELTYNLNIQTGFDGFTSTTLFLSVYRLICKNGMKANVTEFKSTFKNTFGNVGKIQVLCNDVTRAVNSLDKLEDVISTLNAIEVTEAKKQKFLQGVLGYNETTEDLTTRKKNILDRINESIALEISRSGGTLWGLLNGVTHYTNHIAKPNKGMSGAEYREAVDQYIHTETGETLNDKAFKTALALVN